MTNLVKYKQRNRRIVFLPEGVETGSKEQKGWSSKESRMEAIAKHSSAGDLEYHIIGYKEQSLIL